MNKYDKIYMILPQKLQMQKNLIISFNYKQDNKYTGMMIICLFLLTFACY